MTGAIDVLWAVGFWLLYFDPLKFRANAAELHFIREGGGRLEWKKLVRNGDHRESVEVPMRRFLRSRKLWGLVIAHMEETCANWFFLT